MPRFVVESYSSWAGLDEARLQARLTAERGANVTYLRTMFLLDEETALHVFEAPSAEALARAGRDAALGFQRIVEAIESSASDDTN
jgi:hypothetical protein